MIRYSILPCLLLSLSLPAQIVINEVDYDQVGADNEEFIEIKNIGSTPFPMEYVAILMVNGSGGGAAIYRTVASASWAPLDPGAYFVICASGTTANCDEMTTPATNLVQNGAPDAIALVTIIGTDTVLLDAVSYEGDVPGYTEGTGSTVEDSNTAAGVSLSRWPDGSDTDDNSVDFRLGCITPGATNNINPADCDLSTGIATVAATASSFTAMVDPNGDGILLYYGSPAVEPVTFEVFNIAGSLLATHTVSATTKAAWSWEANGVNGGMFLVRASTSGNSMVRRIVLP